MVHDVSRTKIFSDLSVKLLNKLHNGVWMIEPRYAEALKPRVLQLINGEREAFFSTEEEDRKAEKEAVYCFAPTANGFVKTQDVSDLPENSIAVFKLSGPVMKETFCGIAGTAYLREQIKEALIHPNIGSVIMITDTGGGAVDGTFELADDLYEANKPIIGFVDGMSCSAGYAIMAGCKEIYASHKTAEVGSIGVCVSLINRDEQYKKYGIVEHYYNASTSPDKNQAFLKAREGDGTLLQKNMLDPTHKVFKETVQRGRGKVSENALTGNVYLAEEAQQIGLIDGIATLEDVVNHAYELSTKNLNLV